MGRPNVRANQQTRVARLMGHLRASTNDDHTSATDLVITATVTAGGEHVVRIGDVTVTLYAPLSGLEQFVPIGYVSRKRRHAKLRQRFGGTRSWRISSEGRANLEEGQNESDTEPREDDQDLLRALRFMLQKDSLNQDIYLLGPPGPRRRRLVKMFCEMTQRPMEYVALSRDTTESDLKQRREISNGTAEYVDCVAVRAALDGSVLVLDGIEKAERNVMPLLNNLLENREMALEDGRFMVAPKHYDELIAEHGGTDVNSLRLVRTSERFRVIALGLPIPAYRGNTLDPPFRSRFQARDVGSLAAGAQQREIQRRSHNNVSKESVQALTQCGGVLSELRHAPGSTPLSALPELPQGIEESAGKLWALVPSLNPQVVFELHYPFSALLRRSTTDERSSVLDSVMARFGFLRSRDAVEGTAAASVIIGEKSTGTHRFQASQEFLVGSVERFDGPHAVAHLVPRQEGGATVGSPTAATVSIVVPAGLGKLTNPATLNDVKNTEDSSEGADPFATERSPFVLTTSAADEFARMVLAHALGDICLIGEKGGGKSALVGFFARSFGYQVEHIPLYKDMSARGLLQRRSTRPNGDTLWEDSSLITAAITGRLAVLDGIEQLPASSLATLQQLVQDREVSLPNGSRLMDVERFEALVARESKHAGKVVTREELLARGVRLIHPSFRIIALARPAGSGATGMGGSWQDWLGGEVACMFRFIHITPLETDQQKRVLSLVAPRVPSHELDRLMNFASTLRHAVSSDDLLSVLESSVSLRQLIRICRRISGEADTDGSHDLYEAIQRAALSRFLPPVVLDTLRGILEKCEIRPKRAPNSTYEQTLSIEVELPTDDVVAKDSVGAYGYVCIGDMRVPIPPPRDPVLVPNVLFYDNPRQTLMLMEMLRDWSCGQHLLLIGNQGVGKNKLADRMLELLALPREYIQLHRDTTVQNLTSNPTVENGVLKYEDSPLVRAAREGRVLVVDEADKAPTHVTAILKALVEDRSMLLSDGRRIVDMRDVESGVVASGDGEGYIVLHPDFRVMALANRPGFPFHGNDFFREVGDVFACHAIDNPDTESEMHLLRKYGPDIPIATLRKLVGAFDELRSMSDSGQLSYPYSTRELSAVVKHMQGFPRDGIDRILRNVFDFDNYAVHERDLLINVFAKHGVPFSLGKAALGVSAGKTVSLGTPILRELWWPLATQGAEQSLPISHEMASLSTVCRMNMINNNLEWKMKTPTEITTMGQIERPSDIFTEELFRFKVPRGLVINACKLKDNSIVLAVRGSSFMLHHIDPAFGRCEVYDLHGALPADGTYRSIPKTAQLFALDPSTNKFRADLLVVNPASRCIFLLRMGTDDKTVVYMDTIPVTDNLKQLRVCLDEAGNNVAIWQDYEPLMFVLDLNQGTIKTLRLPAPIHRTHTIEANKWLVLFAPSENDPEGLSRCGVLESAGDRGVTLKPLHRKMVDDRSGDTTEVDSPWSMEYVSQPLSSAVPGVLTDDSVRFVRLTRETPEDNERMCMAMGLVDSIGRGEKARMFELSGAHDEEVKLLGAEADDVVESKARVSTMMLGQSQLALELREKSAKEPFAVMTVFDLVRHTRRSIKIGLEDDLDGSGSAASMHANKAKEEALKKQKEVFSSMRAPHRSNMISSFEMRRLSMGDALQRLFVIELDGQRVMTVDCLGWCRVWLVDERAIREAFDVWRKMMGQGSEGHLKIEMSGGDDSDSDEWSSDDEDCEWSSGEEDEDALVEGGIGVKGKKKKKKSKKKKSKKTGKGKGKGDGDGEGEGEGDGEGSGEGNGNGQGGSGGQAGKGGGSNTGKAKGKSGWGQIDDLPDPGSFENVAIDDPSSDNRRSKLQEDGTEGGRDEEDEEDEAVKEATRQVKKEQWNELLDDMDMTAQDFEKYQLYKDAVAGEVRELRVILEGLEARQHERVWNKNQSVGDLDDDKLIDGLTGERSIYKRRAEQAPDSSMFQPLPKRMHILFDLSMSMSRYAADGRLERSLETAVMLMEALNGFQHKFNVCMSGHSGDSHNVELVPFGKFPKTDKERLAVIKKMHAHTETCDSGDNTMDSVRMSVREITKEPGDEYYVFLISDANLDQYGIRPQDMEKLLTMDRRVHVFALFIATIGDQAQEFQNAMPGKIMTVLDKRQLPRSLKRMFLTAASTASSL